MPDTWKSLSKKYIGYVAPPTYDNQKYVTAMYAQDLMRQGHGAYEIGLIYNGGEAKPHVCTDCKVPYDSGKYARTLAALVAME